MRTTPPDRLTNPEATNHALIRDALVWARLDARNTEQIDQALAALDALLVERDALADAEIERVEAIRLMEHAEKERDRIRREWGAAAKVAGGRIAAAEASLTRMEAERDEAREEIEIDNKLIAERDRILDACPCPVHGRCVPHVLDELASLTRYRNALEQARIDIVRVNAAGFDSTRRESAQAALAAIDAALDGPKEEQ